MKNLTKAITFPQFSSITAYDEEDVFIGDIAEQYFRKSASTSGTDKTFGLRDKDGKFYIGSKEAKIKENNIIVVNKPSVLTPIELKTDAAFVILIDQHPICGFSRDLILCS